LGDSDDDDSDEESGSDVSSDDDEAGDVGALEYAGIPTYGDALITIHSQPPTRRESLI
jgi:hypothetical protein